MGESRELQTARRSLAAGERGIGSADGLERLNEGLALLEEIAANDKGGEAEIARNLAATYAGRVYERVGAHVASDRQMPEPALEHYFKVVLAFDCVADALPASAAELKIAVVRALIERYYEGHPPEKKAAALAELDALGPR
jgi:hypothetical protein